METLVYEARTKQIHVRNPRGNVTLCGQSVKNRRKWIPCWSNEIDCPRCSQIILRPKWAALYAEIKGEAIELSSEKFSNIWPEVECPDA